MKMERKFHILVQPIMILLIMTVLTACAGKESKESSAPEDETVITAEWNQAGITVQDARQVELRGNILISSSWTYDAETASYRDLKVVMKRNDGGGETVIFSGDKIQLFKFFIGTGNEIFYLYQEKELVLRKDIVDAEGNVETQYCNIIEADILKNEEGYIRIAKASADAGGRLTLLLRDGRLIHFDDAGKFAFATNTLTINTAGSVEEGLVVIGGENYYYNAEAERLVLWRIDYEAGGVAGKEYVSYEGKGTYYGAYSGYEQGFYIVTDEGLYHYLTDRSYGGEIISWRNVGTGITADGIRALGFTADGNVCLYYDDGRTASTVEIKAVSAQDGVGRQKIVMSGVFNNDIEGSFDGQIPIPTEYELVAEYVEEFNRYSSQYYIEIKNYDVRETSAFYMDLIRGEGADIFILDNMPVENLANKGILEELTPYFEASKVVNKDDIEEAAWRAGAVGEGEYLVFPYFYVQGYLAAPQVADENGVLSIDALFSALEQYPDSTISDGENTPAFLIINQFSMEIEKYLDLENGTCSFDNEEFIRLLERTNEYVGQKRRFQGQADPESVSRPIGEWLCNHKCLLCPVYWIASGDYLDMREGALASCTLTGYPTSSGETRYRFMKNQTYGINSASGCKEGAWAFLEFLLSKEIQEEMIMDSRGYYSERKDINEAMFAQLLDRSHRIFKVPGHLNLYSGQMQEEYGIFTEEDKEALRYIIDHAYPSDSMWVKDISTVMIEELNAYFAGDKTAKDTARTIQQRLEIYLGEME